jgi:hypothetical protein
MTLFEALVAANKDKYNITVIITGSCFGFLVKCSGTENFV